MNSFTDVKDLSFKSKANFVAMAKKEGIVLGEWLVELLDEVKFDGKNLDSEEHALGEIDELGLSEETCMLEVKRAMGSFSLKKMTPVQALRAFVKNIDSIKESKKRFIAYMSPIRDRDGEILFGSYWSDGKLHIKAYQINSKKVISETVFVALR